MRFAINLPPSEVKKIEKVMLDIERKVNAGAEASVDEVGNAMRSYARLVAPKSKNFKRLMRLIKYYKAKKGRKYGELISGNPTKNPPKSYRSQGSEWSGGSDFNLAYWFAHSPKAVKHARTGEAKYMDLAWKYGNRLFEGIVDRELTKKLK